MYLKYNYNYYLCSKFIINNLCPIKFKLAIIQFSNLKSDIYNV